MAYFTIHSMNSKYHHFELMALWNFHGAYSVKPKDTPCERVWSSPPTIALISSTVSYTKEWETDTEGRHVEAEGKKNQESMHVN